MTTLHTWMFFSLLTSLLWAIVNVLDKTILSRYNLDPWFYLALDGIVGIVPILAILLSKDNLFAVPLNSVVLALLSGITLSIFTIIYFYSLQISDVQVVVLLIQTTPLFSLMWGTILLDERYKLIVYIGMLLVITGSIIASMSEKPVSRKLFNHNKTLIASILMVLAALVLSVSYLSQNVSLRSADVLTVFFWQRVSLLPISIAVFSIKKINLFKFPSRPILFTFLIEVINLVALLSITTAYSIGTLSNVTFLASLQPVWVLILVWMQEIMKLKLFPSNSSVSRMRIVIACAFVMSGIYLISYYTN